MFSVAFLLACSAVLQLTVGDYAKRYYTIRLTVGEEDIDDGTSTPLWFRLGGANNSWTEWFSASQLPYSGTGYDLSRDLKNIGNTPEKLTLVKFDDDFVRITELGIDTDIYVFKKARFLGVPSDVINANLSSKSACDAVTVDFIKQSYENEYYLRDCPYASSTIQNTTYSYNNTNLTSIMNKNTTVNATVNAVYVSYSDYLNGSVNKSVNTSAQSITAPKESTLRLYNAHGENEDNCIGCDNGNNTVNNSATAVPLTAPDSLPPPPHSTLYSM